MPDESCPARDRPRQRMCSQLSITTRSFVLRIDGRDVVDRAGLGVAAPAETTRLHRRGQEVGIGQRRQLDEAVPLSNSSVQGRLGARASAARRPADAAGIRSASPRAYAETRSRKPCCRRCPARSALDIEPGRPLATGNSTRAPAPAERPREGRFQPRLVVLQGRPEPISPITAAGGAREQRPGPVQRLADRMDMDPQRIFLGGDALPDLRQELVLADELPRQFCQRFSMISNARRAVAVWAGHGLAGLAPIAIDLPRPRLAAYEPS